MGHVQASYEERMWLGLPLRGITRWCGALLGSLILIFFLFFRSAVTSHMNNILVDAQHGLRKRRRPWMWENAMSSGTPRIKSRSTVTTFSMDKSGKRLPKRDVFGVKITKDLKWGTRIQTTATKAKKTSAYMQRNSKSPITVKTSCYKGMARLFMEYAATVWYPYQQYLSDFLKKAQRRFARRTLQD